MLDAFLRCASHPLRFAVLSTPSARAHTTIKALWSLGHTVFPILPHRARYLTHLLAESRANGLVMDGLMDGSFASDAKAAAASLGIHTFTPVGSISTGTSSGSPVIIEARSPGSTIPMAALLSTPTFAHQAAINRDLLALTESSVPLLMSSNWLLDSESLSKRTFLDISSKATPDVIRVDADSVDTLIASIGNGLVDPSRLETVIFDVVSSADQIPNVDEIGGKLAATGCANVKLRYIVPEYGPVAQLVPLESANGGLTNLKAVDGISLNVRDGKLCVAADIRYSLYIGREKTTREAINAEGFFESAIVESSPPAVSESKPLRRKRRIMQPDWRVRKVPIAVYNKKRGFKGQIYYTTKHKGWSFYKSRYYN